MNLKQIEILLFAFAALGAAADTWTDPDTGYTWISRIADDENMV
mgnify:CR=1 FL=1